MKSDRRFYVYAYYEPEAELPFYIGKGHGSRASKHLNESRVVRGTHFYNKLRKMLRLGLDPRIEFLHTSLTEDEAFRIEREQIEKYGRRDLGTGCLCNQTNGGDGQSGSTALRGRKKSPEHVAKMAASKRGKKQSREHVAKVAAALRGKKRSPDAAARTTQAARQNQGRAVRGVNPTTGESKTYAVLRDVVTDGFRFQNVHQCCSGRKKSHGGWVWSYAGPAKANPETPERVMRRTAAVRASTSRPVQSLDRRTGEIKAYAAVADVKKDGYLPQAVSDCCCGRRKSHGGLIWSRCELGLSTT